MRSRIDHEPARAAKVFLLYSPRPEESIILIGMNGTDREDFESPEAARRMRAFLKDTIRKRVDFSLTDQNRGVPPPPVEKPISAGQQVIALPPRGQWKTIPPHDLARAIENRRSRRSFLRAPLSLEELSFLLWASHGVSRRGDGYALRTVPSAGARHALETYVCALEVQTLRPGVYRYLPLEHGLAREFLDDGLASKLAAATFEQEFVGRAAAVFVWAAVPYRMEWRYGPVSVKVIAIDAGHVCQNLYLACEALAAGTCAVAAYDQEAMDLLIRLDGEDEFVVYLAPVGKV
jgi:SagB-type dehydrogenase family enzyme